MIHPNSTAAREAVAHQIPPDAEMVFDCIKAFGPMTARNVDEMLGWGDVQRVRRRVTDLLAEGRIYEYGTAMEKGRRLTTPVMILAAVVKFEQGELI